MDFEVWQVWGAQVLGGPAVFGRFLEMDFGAPGVRWMDFLRSDDLQVRWGAGGGVPSFRMDRSPIVECFCVLVDRSGETQTGREPFPKAPQKPLF